MSRAMQQTVDEVGKVAADEDIDCHWAKGGTVQFARSPSQLERATEEVQEARLYGFDDGDLRLLSAAEVLRAKGVLIYEKPEVQRIKPGQLVTATGIVRARHVIRATEGYTAQLAG